MVERKVITKKDEEEYFVKRDRAQTLTFAQIQEIIQRNVKQSTNKVYSTFVKERVKQYLKSPASNLENIREVSRFLERNSMLYKKILYYYATMPLFNYGLTKNIDSINVDVGSIQSNFLKVSKRVNGFNIKKDMSNALYMTVRDGLYVGYAYSNNEHTFLMPLDVQYCRIYGKNSAGQWIVYFNASYFNVGNNKIFVEGVDGDMTGIWDYVFVEGWQGYRQDQKNNQWFRLPPEKCFCMISGSDEQFEVPLPYLLPLFISLMDLLDFEQILADKAEIENYKLLVSKIPLISGSEDVDDFSVSLDLVKKFDAQYDPVLPEQVGHIISPGLDLDVITFEKSNSTEDSDILANSISNLFSNAGVSQLVVSGGSTTSSVGLKYAILNDHANVWVFVNRIESWLDYFVKENISKDYALQIYPISWYNRDELISEAQTSATLGGDALTYLTIKGDTPYIAYQKILLDNALGLKEIMKPLMSSYTLSDNDGGRPKSDEGDLSDEGTATRDKEKNEGTKTNK